MNSTINFAQKLSTQFNSISTTVVFIFIFLSSFSFGQTNIVNGEQFNTATVPTVPAAWTAGSWDLNFNYNTNCRNAAAEVNCAKIVSTGLNSYFWIPVTFQNGYTYSVNLWKKNAKNMGIVFNDAKDLLTTYSTETVVNANTAWAGGAAGAQVTFTTYTHSAVTGAGFIGICAVTSNGSTMYVDELTVTETPPTCTYPSTNATITGVTNVGQNTATLTWSGGNGDKHLVVAKASASVLTQPSDGGNYTANAVFGNGSQLGTGNYVVYDGTGTTVNVTNLDPATTYNFYVYEYKTTGPCYKVAGATISQATTACSKYYVNDGATTGDIFCNAVGNNSKTGMGPGKPKLSLSNLLSSGYTFNAGDTIYIDAGTYNNEVSINFSASGITFLGAGNTLTIIDNLGAGMATNYFMYVTGSNVTFKNMTIKGYENNGTQTPGHSGQALTIGGSATGVLIENVIMSGNGASGGNPSIVVLANTSVTIRSGGGLCNVWKTAYTGGIEVFGNGITLNILDYILAYNFKTGAYDGGGLLINNANSTTTVNVSNTQFFNNEASDGGAISQRGGILNVTDCIINGNFAGQTSTPIYGGGVRMTGGTATYTRTKFTNNALGSAGGTLRGAAIGLYTLDDAIDLTLDNCYFSGNVGAEGDDLYADKFSANAINVHISESTFSSSTDAIFNKDADLIQLTNSGNPTVSGSNSPAVTKVNTTIPSSIPSPSVPGIASGDCASGISLPVELISFTASCESEYSILNWQTASEKNNDYFDVEKSKNGIDFITIGQVNGNGNSSILQNYSFQDDEPNNGGTYYRLKQVDFNGEHTYSDLTSSKCDGMNNNSIYVYPNPATDEIKVSLGVKTNEEVVGYIINVLGERIISFSNNNMNNSALNLSISELSNGLYNLAIFSAKTGEMMGISKFIKK